MSEFQLQDVPDGPRRRLRFQGRVLGEASSRRPGSPRWSEVTIFGLPRGEYVLARRGCSTMVHRPDCRRANREMTAWLELPFDRDRQQSWTGCPECQPDLVEWDPQTLVEPTRHAASHAADAEKLIALLWERPPHLPPLNRIAYFLRAAAEQACVKDAALAAAWAHHGGDAAR